MLLVQSARVGRGEIEVSGQAPDPDDASQMKEVAITMDAVIVTLNLGAGGDLQFALDPELGEKVSGALGRACALSGKIVPADLSQMPKAPFGRRDGVPQQ